MNFACSTCLESFTPGSDISSTPCGHVFHTDCITRWLGNNNNNNCSQCRKICDINDLKKLFISEFDSGIIDELETENLRLQTEANESKNRELEAISRELEANKKIEKQIKENLDLKNKLRILNKQSIDSNQKIVDLENEILLKNQMLERAEGAQASEMQQDQQLLNTGFFILLHIGTHFSRLKMAIFRRLEMILKELQLQIFLIKRALNAI